MSYPPYGQPSYGQPPQPPYGQPPSPHGTPPQQATLRCPRCEGVMRTYNRNGIQIEQCETCRGIFLDFGELESLTRLESQFMQPPPPAQPYAGGYAQGPAWGQHGGQRYHKGGFGRLFFSS